MQFALRGQQKEASERYPGLVRGGWSTETKDQSRGQTTPVQLCTWNLYRVFFIFYFKSTVNRFSVLVRVHTEGATATHEDRMRAHDDTPLPSVSYHGMMLIISQCIQISFVHYSEAVCLRVCDIKCKRRRRHSGLALRLFFCGIEARRKCMLL